MAFKKSKYVALLFVGYTAVGFAMQSDMEAILRKYGVTEKNIEKTLLITNRNKTPEEVVKDFYDMQSEKNFDVHDELKEFFDIEDNELSLENFPENKQKTIAEATVSTVGTYFSWLVGVKK